MGIPNGDNLFIFIIEIGWNNFFKQMVIGLKNIKENSKLIGPKVKPKLITKTKLIKLLIWSN